MSSAEMKRLKSLKNDELRSICKKNKIKGYSGKNKSELCKMILSVKRKDVSLYKMNNNQFEEYTINKTILIISGCFCPPHAGHYNMVNSVIKKAKPDIVIIETTNRKCNARHGVPLEHSLATWKEWGKIIQNKLDVDVLVYPFFEAYELFDFISPNVKKIISVKSFEKDIPANIKHNSITRVDTKTFSEGMFERVPRSKIYNLNNIRQGNLSATKFTKCLKDFLQDCHEYVPDDVKNKTSYVKNIRKKYGEKLK